MFFQTIKKSTCSGGGTELNSNAFGGGTIKKWFPHQKLLEQFHRLSSKKAPILSEGGLANFHNVQSPYFFFGIFIFPVTGCLVAGLPGFGGTLARSSGFLSNCLNCHSLIR